MTDPVTISADYTLRPSELAATLALLVEARQPVVVWGPPGSAKSMIAQQVAAGAGRAYVDVRALLLDPVDLRGIPWRDGSDRTRWAPPAFLPPTDDPGRWLINLEELPSAVPMVQAALYQLVLDRKVGEYELPDGASLIACGNREVDRGVTHRMPTPLASPSGASTGADDGSPDSRDGDGADVRGDPGQDDSNDTPSSCDPAGTGEIMDAPAGGAGAEGSDDGPSARDIAAEEQAWDEAMHQATSLAKAEGRMPGAIEETVWGAHASTVDWRTLLRRYMTDAAKRDYSWSVPNRRFIDSGLYLPSIRSEGIDAIAVIIDTSGSLDPETLAAFWSEVREVATEIEPERVILLQVDTAVRDAAEYAAGDLPDEIVVRGRGGTDFRPGFAWLEEHAIRPGVCLYLTDMECSRYPEAEPAFDVLWVNWGQTPSDWNREPWGERIDIGAE